MKSKTRGSAKYCSQYLQNVKKEKLFIFFPVTPKRKAPFTDLGLMAQSHCTEPGMGTASGSNGGQGTQLDTFEFYTNFSVPVPAKGKTQSEFTEMLKTDRIY